MQGWELTMKLRSHSCWLIFFCCLVMPAYNRISCLAGRLSSTSDLMRRSRKGFSTLCSLLICAPARSRVLTTCYTTMQSITKVSTANAEASTPFKHITPTEQRYGPWDCQAPRQAW